MKHQNLKVWDDFRIDGRQERRRISWSKLGVLVQLIHCHLQLGNSLFTVTLRLTLTVRSLILHSTEPPRRPLWRPRTTRTLARGARPTAALRRPATGSTTGPTRHVCVLLPDTHPKKISLTPAFHSPSPTTGGNSPASPWRSTPPCGSRGRRWRIACSPPPRAVQRSAV